MTIRRRPEKSTIAVESLTFYMKTGIDKPDNILEEIVWHKEIEVDQQREKFPLFRLKKQVDAAPAPLDFAQALRDAPWGLIAEVKKASPSRGVLRDPFDPVEIARAYVQGGAACLSVLTDQKFFQGSFENLQLIRQAVAVPLLCKEFILHAYQIFMARAYGADAILLIVALHTDQDLQYLHRIARGLGMAVLVEVHTLPELDRAVAIPNVQLIGVNNRNLEDFTVDLGTTGRLIDQRRSALKDILIIAESGIHRFEDMTLLKSQGCTGFLVGEQLVKAPDPAAAVRHLLGVG